ncbi:hypothetical protein ACFFIX_20480 [Metabacillus herbersteinensis]|uniref:Uncharacterized protein n=1 Tax=Metabacillus herbersteinensis TaxID=283816 RepID=A0ABV6GJ98_9BACI
MVLIDIASRERIVEVIEYFLDNGEFESVFTRYPDEEVEDANLYPKGFFSYKL